MEMTFSIVGTRRKCARKIKAVARSNGYGVIRDVKLTKINFYTYHLTFIADIK